ncbi:MAG: HTTM domain-containing protein [Planctomycetota bacterium]|nr:HTTM domain-containing protein [Planctomycetota bacterium]
MNLIGNYFVELYRATISGWNRFWFTAVDPATLGLVRLLAGAMLFYTHLVWSIDLEGFFGQSGWQTPSALVHYQESPYAWSYLFWIKSPALLWTAHIVALVILFLFFIGWQSRIMAVLAFVITLAYAQRVSMANFGLDNINEMLAMYLMLGPCGAAFSVDSWLKRRREQRAEQGRGGDASSVTPSVSGNIAIRLIQLHMCVIYLFAGLGKVMGASWWDGTAMWLSIANLEYQTIDATFLANWPVFLSFVAHLTVAWELSYCVLVWPRLTRPLVLALAVPLHLGIALFLGMITFGLVMLIGNLAFVSPWLVRYLFDRKRSTEIVRGLPRRSPEPVAS